MLDLISLLRLKNAIAPLLWLLIGYTAGGGENFWNLPLVLCLIGLLLLNFFATAQNDLSDLVIDAGSGRVSALTNGKISERQLTIITYSLAIIALGLPLLFGRFQIFLLLAVYALICCLYNLTPTQFSRRPIMSVFILGICFSTLPALYGLVISGQRLTISLVSLLIGGFLLRTSLSALKDYKDYSGDKKHSKNTFLIHFGPNTLKLLSLAAYSLGSFLIIAAILIKIGFRIEITLVITLLVAYSFSERLKLGSSKKQYESNNRLFHHLLDLCLLFEAGVLTCFYIY